MGSSAWLVSTPASRPTLAELARQDADGNWHAHPALFGALEQVVGMIGEEVGTVDREIDALRAELAELRAKLDAVSGPKRIAS